MNKLTTTMITTMVATLLLTGAATALAQNPNGEPGRKGQRHQRQMQAMPLVKQMMRAIKRLNVDEAQREGIRAVMQGLKAEIRPIMGEMKAGHMQLKALIKAGSYDEQAVAALADREGDLASKRLIVSSKALSEVYSYLTDEQRAELEAMAAQHKARRGERRKQSTEES